MSFRCQKCGEPRPSKDYPGEYAPKLVVTKTRSHAELPGKRIVQELRMCANCAASAGEPVNTVVGTPPRHLNSGDIN